MSTRIVTTRTRPAHSQGLAYCSLPYWYSQRERKKTVNHYQMHTSPHEEGQLCKTLLKADLRSTTPARTNPAPNPAQIIDLAACLYHKRHTCLNCPARRRAPPPQPLAVKSIIANQVPDCGCPLVRTPLMFCTGACAQPHLVAPERDLPTNKAHLSLCLVLCINVCPLNQIAFCYLVQSHDNLARPECVDSQLIQLIWRAEVRFGSATQQEQCLRRKRTPNTCAGCS